MLNFAINNQDQIDALDKFVGLDSNILGEISSFVTRKEDANRDNDQKLLKQTSPDDILKEYVPPPGRKYNGLTGKLFLPGIGLGVRVSSWWAG